MERPIDRDIAHNYGLIEKGKGVEEYIEHCIQAEGTGYNDGGRCIISLAA